jgi:hypothetical protein
MAAQVIDPHTEVMLELCRWQREVSLRFSAQSFGDGSQVAKYRSGRRGSDRHVREKSEGGSNSDTKVRQSP